MTNTSAQRKRTLAIAPTTRGFGFAVMESDGKLADWGAVGIPSNKNAVSTRKVGELIELYRPDILVIEDFASNPCRRTKRIHELAEALRSLAKSRGISFQKIPAATVRRTMCGEADATKQTLAERLAELFPPELGYLVPRKRKPWMNEDYRMAIFEAVALGFVSPQPDTK